jgi:hypothetical protein
LKKITNSAAGLATGLDAGQVISWTSWHRWTAIRLLAYLCLAVTVAVQRQQEASSDPDDGLIRVTVPELLRHRHPATSARPALPAALVHVATRHQHRARQAQQRWKHLCRDNTMITTNYSRRNCQVGLGMTLGG